MGHRKLTILPLALALAAGPVAAAETDESAYWKLEDVSIPKEAHLEVGGMTFTPDGTLYVCTRRGEIWARDAKGSWRLWASGLHEALGLLPVGNGDLITAQRPELTRVRDTDRDGKADRFETLTDAFGLTGNYHEYHFGPVRDRKGNLYGTLNLAWEGRGVSWTPYRGWAYRVTPKGEFQPFAVGFRSPSGIGMSPDGEIFVTDNQGDWMATSPLFHVKEGGFYGHPAGLKWEKGYAGPNDPADQPVETFGKRRTLPVAWFPYGVAGHAPSEPVWDTTGGKFGPYRKHMLVGDQTKSFISRVVLEKVGGEYQGAVFPFRRGFGSGIIRMVFDRQGALWVGGTDRGWGATGGKPFALQRLTWTGKVPFEMEAMKVTKTGFEVSFTRPVDPKTAADPGAWSLQHYQLRYWKTYGSPHVDTTAVNVQRAEVSRDGRRVTLTLGDLQKERIYELHLRGVKAADGAAPLHEAAYYTLNRVP